MSWKKKFVQRGSANKKVWESIDLFLSVQTLKCIFKIIEQVNE